MDFPSQLQYAIKVKSSEIDLSYRTDEAQGKRFQSSVGYKIIVEKNLYEN